MASKLSILLTGNNAELKRVLDDSAQQIRRFGQSTERIGRQLTRNVSLPLGAIGGASLKLGADFGFAMNTVRGVTRAAGDEFERLSEQAQDMGARTMFSATQAAEAQRFLGMAGFETGQIFAALPATLQLAAAGNLDLATSADIASNILSGYQLDVSELGRATDVLARTFTSTNTDLVQLGDAFRMAGPIAAAAGQEFEITAAILGQMGNAGIQSSLAGTSLRGALAALLNPTAQVSDRLQKLGIATKDAEGNLLPLTVIVRQLEEAGASAGDMMEIFGRRAGPAMAAVVGQGSSALMELTNELRNADGAAEELANITMEGLTGAFRELRSASEAALIGLSSGGPMDGAEAGVRGLSALLRDTSDILRELPDGVKVTAFALGGLAVAAGPVLVGLGAMMKMAPLVAMGFAAITSPAAILVGIAGTLAFAGVTVARNWTETKIQVTLAWTAMKGAAFDAIDGILGGLERMASWIPGLGDRIQGLRADFDAWADESLAKSGRRMAELEREIAENFTPAAEEATAAAGALGHGLAAMGDEGADAMDGLVPPARAARDAIAEAFAALARQLQVASGMRILDIPGADEARAQLQAYQAALQALLAEGVEPSDARVQELASNISTLNEEMEDARVATERMNELERARASVLQDIQTPLEGYLSQLELLNELMSEGMINQEQMDRALKAASDAFDESTRKAAGATNTWQEEFAGSMRSMASNASRDFSSMANRIIAEIQRIIAQMLIFRAFTTLLAPFAGGGGLGGALFSAFSGNREHGGPVQAGNVYMVGERGRELFVPSSQGHIVPNHAVQKMAKAGGGSTLSLDLSTFPAAQNPIQAARDPEIQRWFRELARVAEAQGFSVKERS